MDSLARVVKSVTLSPMMKPVLILTIVLFAKSAGAQPAEGGGKGDFSGKNVGTEMGFHIGNLLPNQISGVTEITGLGGVRGGYKIGNMIFAESSIAMGNGDGVEWKNLDLGIRMDIPVENLVGMAYIGPDITYYKPSNSGSTKIIFGAHAGGGVQTKLGETIWFRGDMKFGISPGTSLYISFGFVFRFAGGSGGGGES